MQLNLVNNYHRRYGNNVYVFLQTVHASKIGFICSVFQIWDTPRVYAYVCAVCLQFSELQKVYCLCINQKERGVSKREKGFERYTAAACVACEAAASE